MSTVLRAIAEPHRAEILRLLRRRELPAGAIAARFAETRPAISQHLRVLVNAGLVAERREGTKRLYRLNQAGFAELRDFVAEFWDEQLRSLKAAAEEEARKSVAEEADVTREIFIEAPPALVFGFLTDSDKIVRWIGVSAELDPVAGGLFRVSPNGREVIEGRFVEVAPFRRVVFTWGFAGEDAAIPAGSTTVEITLTPENDGTRLRLRHRGLGAGEPRKGHDAGWVHYLKRLQTVAEGRDPGPDRLATGDSRHG